MMEVALFANYGYTYVLHFKRYSSETTRPWNQTLAIQLFLPHYQYLYFQGGLNNTLNNTQYQYQFLEETLTIPNTNIHEGS